MSKKNQHVVPNESGWGIKGEGNSRLTKILPTKNEALGVARTIARNQGVRYLSMEKTARFKIGTAMAMTPVLLRIRNIK